MHYIIAILRLTLLFKNIDMNFNFFYFIFLGRKINASAARRNVARRNLGYLSCGSGNPIDDCWRCDPNWENNRQRLADCSIGFGKNAIGGRDGKIYVVDDDGNDDPVNPKPGIYPFIFIRKTYIVKSIEMNRLKYEKG